MTDEINQVNPETPAQPQVEAENAESAPATPAAKPADDAGELLELSRKAQKRIDTLFWEKSEAERRAQRAEELLQKALGQKEEQKSVKPPTLAQFDYDEAKYLAAVQEYTDARLEEKLNARLTEREQLSEKEKLTKSFLAREAEFSKATPDYKEKVYDPTLQITPVMAEVIAQSDEGPAIAYHLANNPELASQIARLSPMAAAREIGRIEAGLAKPPKPKVSTAPPPPPKVDDALDEVDVRPGDPDSDKLSDAEWMKKREKELRNRKK
jgi:hypothetical protein